MRITKRIKSQMSRIRAIWAAAEADRAVRVAAAIAVLAEKDRRNRAIAAEVEALSKTFNTTRIDFRQSGVWYDERATILPSVR